MFENRGTCAVLREKMVSDNGMNVDYNLGYSIYV